MSDLVTLEPRTLLEYPELVRAVRRFVEERTPPDAVVAVISRGDDELVTFGGRRQGWHFPRSLDGRYAGHYPADDAAATRHLEKLARHGAQFLVVPATALWWLDHYPGFRRHLEEKARPLLRSDEVGRLYELDGQRGHVAADPVALAVPSHSEPVPEDLEWDRWFDELCLIVDVEYYGRQCGTAFATAEAAARHYVERARGVPRDPSPLVDGEWYLDQHPRLRAARVDPVLHFLACGARAGFPPSPYFDVEYYYEQRPSLHERGVNALVHYVERSSDGGGYEPNPLFSTPFYHSRHPAARRAGRSALADWLTTGVRRRSLVSPAHGALLRHLRDAGRSSLLRGNWKGATVLLATTVTDDTLLHEAAEELARDHHVEAIVVGPVSSDLSSDRTVHRKLLDLEAFDLAFDVRRPSALRLLLRDLVETRPVAVLTRRRDLPSFRSLGVPTVAVSDDVHRSSRAVVDLVRPLLPLPGRAKPPTGEAARAGQATRRVLIPCSDWSVSGVNAALDALGQELVDHGWDVEILFSRSEEYVTRTMDGGRHAPSIPYRFVSRRTEGVEGMWESLIAEVEAAAPCIVLLGYDFVANSAAPAFSDDVAVVMWVQADDADYYEQSYRLGRYANAVVCVSSCIRDKVLDLNPGLAARSLVVHNSTVLRDEVSEKKRLRSDVLSIVYAGRLVQYQKRVLDFVQLAEALERAGCPFTMTLIGAFSDGDDTRERFLERARDFLQDGRIRLTGRMNREETLAELQRHSFFLLLSDFEGLPLAVVEAMAKGCVPVVADMESGVRELVRDGVNGVILGGRGYDGWARALMDIWVDRERSASLSLQARRTVAAEFTVEKVGSRFHRLFTELATELGRGGYRRPAALHWGEAHARFGDVLPPPTMSAPIDVEGLVEGSPSQPAVGAATPRLTRLRTRRTGDGRSRPRPRSAAGPVRKTTHKLGDLRSRLSPGESPSNLTALHRLRRGRSRTVSLRPAVDGRRRPATPTHPLRDLRLLFDREHEQPGARRIRVCVVDTMLQTGGAEWFAAQLAMKANPQVFEFVFVTFNSRQSPIAKALIGRGFRVLCASTWRRNSLSYSSWLREELFAMLGRLRPDLLLFSSQYLFEQVRDNEHLDQYSVIVRISNFHADELEKADFDRAAKIICCTDEQRAAVSRRYPEKAVLVRTGVDLEMFHPPSDGEREALKRAYGLSGKTVVLFVGRLGSPLKRVPLFQDVVRRVNSSRDDVRFLVVGYFGSQQAAEEAAFERFVADEDVLWIKDAAPWETPALYRMGDLVLSTSADYEGLSNTVLQALAAGVVPVVTASAGMHELVAPGRTGFLLEDGDPDRIARDLLRVVDLDLEQRGLVAEAGRRLVASSFDLAECALAYQREMVGVYRRRPALVAITDGSFGIGGAEWLAALLMVNADPAHVRFELVVHRKGGPLVGWLEDRGVQVHAPASRMTYDEWRARGSGEMLGAIRPDIVMPCTVTTWPRHDPFYRLLAISQNTTDASVLEDRHYEQADLLLCVSEEVRSALSPKYGEKMVVLRNSIDVEMYSPRRDWRVQVRKELGIPEDARVVLWSGRMHQRYKRLDVLMDVVDAIGSDPRIHFLVLGYFLDGSAQEDHWMRFLSHHDNVSWVNRASPWDTPRYYSAADLYLSTSGFTSADFEGLSLTSVQALAAGLPIVTTTSGGQREVVEDGLNGRLVANGDVSALVLAIRELFGLDARAFGELRERNQRRALEHFDIRKHARTYAALARLLKDTVGPALASNPGLPAPTQEFRDDAVLSPQDRARASVFLSYAWPLLPEHRRDATTPAEDGTQVELPETSEAKVVARRLLEMERQLAAGQLLAVPRVGPVRTSSGPAAVPPSALVICGVLDYLDGRFAAWSECRRRGPDLILRKA